MAKLAIKGHSTRGKEVIEILEMLGGKNTTNLHGECDNMIYIINSSYYGEIIYMLYRTDGYVVFTIEEFLEKFPYRVGDKVLYKYDNTTYFIRKMFWENDKVLYKLSDEVYSDGCSIPDTLIFDVDAVKLQPYKEETMKEFKIEIPEGYCIDKENSTFECIKFKKKPEVKIYTTSVGVRVDTPECSFYILDKEDLATDGYSSFKLAKLYHRDATLPSKEQWEIIYKHLNEINRFLNNKIEKVCYWTSDLGESPAYQWFMNMLIDNSNYIFRYNTYRVRPIINNNKYE